MKKSTYYKVKINIQPFKGMPSHIHYECLSNLRSFVKSFELSTSDILNNGWQTEKEIYHTFSKPESISHYIESGEVEVQTFERDVYVVKIYKSLQVSDKLRYIRLLRRYSTIGLKEMKDHVEDRGEELEFGLSLDEIKSLSSEIKQMGVHVHWDGDNIIRSLKIKSLDL